MSDLTALELAWCDWMEKRGLRFGTVERRCETASQISFIAGASEERARIRRELKALIEDRNSEIYDAPNEYNELCDDLLLAALDRIAPEEE